MKSYQITEWCHVAFEQQAVRGGRYIDATMGNGHDTLFLCELAGETGHVTAFDIQSRALEATQELLQKHGLSHRAALVFDSHVNMDSYAEPDSVDGIVFNFGYLPGGNHSFATKASTSVAAVEKGLGLLKSGGVMSLCIYSGGDTGFEERDCLLEYVKNLDDRRYVVILSTYYNRKNNPPVPVLIIKRQRKVPKAAAPGIGIPYFHCFGV